MSGISEQYQQSINRFLQISNEKINLLLGRTGEKMKSATLTRMEETNNYASGRLRQTVNYTIDGKTLIFGANAKNKGFPYANVVEFGRRPGTYPNMDAILKWVKRKVLLGHINLSNVQGKTLEKKQENLAWMVSNKIARKGIEGRFPFKFGFEEGLKFFENEINKIIVEAFNE